MYFKTLNMCWNHWVLKNYPLKTFWTVTMDIDSACQTKPLLIGSHHVYSKTNFFQVLLPNWNTLLQPSSLFIITRSDNSDNSVQGKEKNLNFRNFLCNPSCWSIYYLCNDFSSQLVIGMPYHFFCKKYSLHHFTKGLPWKLTFICLKHFNN